MSGQGFKADGDPYAGCQGGEGADGVVARRLRQAHAGECQDAAEPGAATTKPDRPRRGTAEDRGDLARTGAEVTSSLKGRGLEIAKSANRVTN